MTEQMTTTPMGGARQRSNGGAVQGRCALALRTVHSCAVITIAAIVTCWAAGVGAQAQSVQAPEPPQGTQAAKPPEGATPKPSADELERWRQAIAHTNRPKKSCFTAQYPATTWTEVPCGKPPKALFLPAKGPRPLVVGNGTDFSAQAASGFISEAEGSFDSVIGVTSECDVACPTNGCPKNMTCSSSDLKNVYSLQLNTNYFATSACRGHKDCVGWQQFFFVNRDCVGYGVSPLPACAFIEYWLLGYGSNCPSGWQSAPGDTDCAVNSQNSVNFLPYLVQDLGFMKLRGDVAGVQSQDDVVTFTVFDKAYSAPGDNQLPDLGQQWNQAEFNVVGGGNGSQAVFNLGSSLIVRTVVDSGITSAPQCVLTGTTGETNNLTLTELATRPTNSNSPAISSTQPGNTVTGPWSGGPGPALVYAESNAADAIPAPLGSGTCTGYVTVGGPPIPPPRPGGTVTTGCSSKDHCCIPGFSSCQKCWPNNEQCP
jgi:hypothetical protein